MITRNNVGDEQMKLDSMIQTIFQQTLLLTSSTTMIVLMKHHIASMKS